MARCTGGRFTLLAAMGALLRVSALRDTFDADSIAVELQGDGEDLPLPSSRSERVGANASAATGLLQTARKGHQQGTRTSQPFPIRQRVRVHGVEGTRFKGEVGEVVGYTDEGDYKVKLDSTNMETILAAMNLMKETQTVKFERGSRVRIHGMTKHKDKQWTRYEGMSGVVCDHDPSGETMRYLVQLEKAHPGDLLSVELDDLRGEAQLMPVDGGDQRHGQRKVVQPPVRVVRPLGPPWKMQSSLVEPGKVYYLNTQTGDRTEDFPPLSFEVNFPTAKVPQVPGNLAGRSIASGGRQVSQGLPPLTAETLQAQGFISVSQFAVLKELMRGDQVIQLPGPQALDLPGDDWWLGESASSPGHWFYRTTDGRFSQDFAPCSQETISDSDSDGGPPVQLQDPPPKRKRRSRGSGGEGGDRDRRGSEGPPLAKKRRKQEAEDSGEEADDEEEATLGLHRSGRLGRVGREPEDIKWRPNDVDGRGPQTKLAKHLVDSQQIAMDRRYAKGDPVYVFDNNNWHKATVTKVDEQESVWVDYPPPPEEMKMITLAKQRLTVRPRKEKVEGAAAAKKIEPAPPNPRAGVPGGNQADGLARWHGAMLNVKKESL